jgi:chemotaxis regulatin CheY-phosphate phosphatase CheZ
MRGNAGNGALSALPLSVSDQSQVDDLLASLGF